ncbi:MAG TPA: Uma2 family endonuclease [Pyrinomonadaceae bacterium]|nr:Uma2 family endonuclease [Pyrinomonadaceae bacterium]
MATELRFTTADLEVMPDDGKRYEVIDGELYVSKQPSYHHQYTCTIISTLLTNWSKQADNGRVVQAPGVIFAEDDAVAPDVIWISSQRLPIALGEDGKFHKAPELIIEVLSPGFANEKRDRDAKLKLYSRRGVDEYWIVDWLMRAVEIYRRQNAALHLVDTLRSEDVLQTPLLPDFSCVVSTLFDNDVPQSS